MKHLALKSGQPVKYPVEISPVREVTLMGAADLDYWQAELDRQRLTAASIDGQAQLLIAAAAMKFKGISFRELSISVVVEQANTDLAPDAAWLVSAFNSVRLFAFVERKVFQTPYYYGNITLSDEGQSAIRVADGSGGMFSACMATGDFSSRELIADQYHSWEGPIYLPALGGDEAGTKLFFGRIGGQTRTYPFVPQTDKIDVYPSRRHGVFQSLIDSRFIGKTWLVRPAATHAKSKTMARLAVELQDIPA